MFGQLRKQQFATRFERMRAEMELQALNSRSTLELPGDDLRFMALAENDPELRTIRAKIESQQQSIEQLKRSVREGKWGERIKQSQKALEESQAEEKERLETLQQLRGRQTDAIHKTQIVEFGHRIQMLTEQEKRLGEDVDEFEEKAESIGSSSLEMELMRVDIEQHDAVVKQVADERQALQVELKSPHRIEVVQPAEVPQALPDREELRRISYTGLGALLAFVVPGFLLVWRDLSRQRINSPADVVQVMRMPLLGTMPLLSRRELSRRTRHSASRGSSANGAMGEEVDKIRTMLLSSTGGNPPRVVLVASAVHGEAKTTLSAQLALSCARWGRKTIIVDTDLRCATLHKLFNVSGSPGLSDHLSENVGLDECIWKTGIDNLNLLPAGQAGDCSFASLSPEKLSGLFSKLSAEFDLVIVDSAPVLPVADTHIVGRHVDATIISTLRDVSEKTNVEAAYDRLIALQITVMGVVLTCPKDSRNYYNNR